ncbi:MAG TPA: helix-turn-helix domain-containing protein [Polyangiaceae bacterium]|nr:helix-turn-helix domain-containing protein [Polyangiaceae bacterium]
MVARGAEISADDLGFAPPQDAPVQRVGGEEAAANDERSELERVLREADGVIARAAAILGVSRQALYRRMQRAGVRLERRITPPRT